MTEAAELAGFCREMWPRLVGALSLATGSRHVAEELAQEALVRVCERWTQVEAMDSPVGWTYRVAFNLSNSHFRRQGAERRARRRLRARVDVPPSEIDGADALALRSAVAALPSDQREVLVLRYFADLPVERVAAYLEIPESTVKTRTRRAIARLRADGLVDDTNPEVEDVG